MRGLHHHHPLISIRIWELSIIFKLQYKGPSLIGSNALSLSLSPCCLSATMLDHDRKKTIMKNIIYCDTWLGWAGLGWAGYRQIDDAGAISTISATFRKEKLNSSFSAISSLILSSSPACLLLSLSSASLASRALLSDGVSSPSARNS